MRQSRTLLSKSVPVVVLISLFILVSMPAYSESVLSGQIICIDAGHGGSDPGAIYDDGTIYLEEKEINLDVAFALSGLLEHDGATVHLTRTNNETYLTNNDRYTFCNAKNSTLLISVHTNSSTNSNSDGSLTLYFKKEDVALAGAIQDSMYGALRTRAEEDGITFTNFGLSRYASGVLLKSNMPAAMAEPVFMSHPTEATWLKETIDGGYCSDFSCRRGEIASAIYQGILDYVASGGGGGDGDNGGGGGGRPITPPGKNK